MRSPLAVGPLFAREPWLRVLTYVKRRLALKEAKCQDCTPVPDLPSHSGRLWYPGPINDMTGGGGPNASLGREQLGGEAGPEPAGPPIEMAGLELLM